MHLIQLRRRLSRSAPMLAAVAGSLWLAACVVAPVPVAQPVVVEPGPVVVAPVAPPPPPGEVIAVTPAPGYIWINGYWTWTGGRHVWTAGHWASPGHRWVPRRWVQGPGGWHQHGGHWAR